MKETHNLEEGSQEGCLGGGTVTRVGWFVHGEGGNSSQR